jgi:hypothetical protein
MKYAFAGFWSALQMIRAAGLEVTGEIVMAGGTVVGAPGHGSCSIME